MMDGGLVGWESDMLRPAALLASLASLAIVLSPLPAAATPYWYAWEGDDWPENQGWTCDIYANGPGDVRTLADGLMTLDGLGPQATWDAYQIYPGAAVEPGAGESFVMAWRLRVDAVNGPGGRDPMVGLYSDDGWGVSLMYSVGSVQSTYEGATIAIAPGSYHAYVLRTEDMRTCALSIDGVLVRVGAFHYGGGDAIVGWGDGGAFSKSLSVWDYYRCGIVPEPGARALLVMLGIAAARVRRP
jgi:hypothetical protein